MPIIKKKPKANNASDQVKRYRALQRSEVLKLRRSARGVQWVVMYEDSPIQTLTELAMPSIPAMRIVPRYMVKAVAKGIYAQWVYKKKYEHLV